MPKKSNKTAHVLSLLTNGASLLTDEEQLIVQPSSQEQVQTVPDTFNPGPPKKEVIVQLPESQEDDQLSHLIKEDLQRELDRQVSSKQDLLASQEGDGDAHQRPPYSPTFMAMFGKHAAADKAPPSTGSPENSHLAVQQEKTDNQPASPQTPAKGGREGDILPISLSQVKSELYVLEDFNDDEEDHVPAPQPATAYQQPELAGGGSVFQPASYQKPAAPIPPNLKARSEQPLYGQPVWGVQARVLHNFAEDILLAQAPPVMQSFNMCICQDCLYDVITMALNAIKPLYYMVTPEQFSAKLADCLEQYGEEFKGELTKACIKIKLDPSHPRHPSAAK